MENCTIKYSLNFYGGCMKKSLILIALLFVTTTLFAQYPPGANWGLVNLERDLNMTDLTWVYKPGKFLDGGRTIWLVAHTTVAPHQTVTFRSTDGGETWQKGTPVTGDTPTAGRGRIANIDAIDANTAFLALIDGTIRKTTDGGVTWRQVHSYLIGSVVGWFGGLKVLNNNVVIAGGDGAVQYYLCRSTDAGETWVQIPALAGVNADEAIYTYGSAMDAYGDNVWFAIYSSTTSETSRPVIRSTDAGLTWEVLRIPSGRNIWGISFVNEKVGMAINQDGIIYLTTDGGENWETVTTVPTGINIRNITAAKNQEKFILIGEYNDPVKVNRQPVIYNSIDNGYSWTKDYTPIPAFQTKSSTADFFSAFMYDDNLGFASFRGGVLYKCGKPEVKKNFNIAVEVGMRDLVFKPGTILDNGNIIWFCGHEITGNRNTYSFVSTNGGTTFTTGSMVTGRTSNIVAYDATTALMAAAENGGGILRTTDGGATWNTVFSPGIFFNGIQTIGPDVVVAYGDGTAGSPYFCKSTNKGVTFAQIPRSELPEDLDNVAYGYQGNGSCTDSYGSHAWFTLYGGGTAPYTYVVRTSDYGNTWYSERISLLGDGATSATLRSISFPTSAFGMAVNRVGEIFLIEDKGNMWVKVNNPSSFYPQDSLFIYNVTGIPETKTFIAGGVRIKKNNTGDKAYGAFITYDLGHTWSEILAPPSGNFTGAFNQGPGTTNLNHHIQAGLYFNENFGYALTHNGRVLKLGDGIVTNLPEDPDGIILGTPKAYALEQNYPNPFNPSTTIKFKLNKTEHVKLVVYDALGKEVRTLLDNNILPGDYSLVFHADGLSSGVYFYTLKVGNTFETKKMVLMK